MKKSGICKTIGVILLVVFGSIACFFGGVSLIEYEYGWDSEEYLQSSSAQDGVDYNIHNKYYGIVIKIILQLKDATKLSFNVSKLCCCC